MTAPTKSEPPKRYQVAWEQLRRAGAAIGILDEAAKHLRRAVLAADSLRGAGDIDAVDHKHFETLVDAICRARFAVSVARRNELLPLVQYLERRAKRIKARCNAAEAKEVVQ